jgi:hypothetical protein
MGIDQHTMREMHTLANGYAAERVGDEIKKIESKIKGSDGQHVYSRAQIVAEIGRILALSYAKGYADCFERVGPKKLIF